MKIKVERIIKAVVFIAIYIVLTIVLSKIFIPKNNSREAGMINAKSRGFYGEPEDTIDVIAIGNSNIYAGYSPLYAWGNYGFSSYVSAEGFENVGESYYVLKEVLSCQSPKVLILETDGLWTGATYSEKIDNAFMAAVNYYVPLIKNHDRWKTMTPESMNGDVNYTETVTTKGEWLNVENCPYRGAEYMDKTDAVESIPLPSIYYLDKIEKLCKDNNIKIIFVTMPTAISWKMEKHNAMTAYAKEHNIPYFDFNYNMEKDYGLDWEMDSRDGGHHLNSFGAQKTTKCIAEYISKNYNITDKRKYASYNAWNELYKSYLKHVNEKTRKAAVYSPEKTEHKREHNGTQKRGHNR